MKFESKVNQIVKNYHKNFNKDPCRHTRTQAVNVHVRVSSRQNARAHVYASCARVCAQIFTIFFFGSSLLSFEFQFQIS